MVKYLGYYVVILEIGNKNYIWSNGNTRKILKINFIFTLCKIFKTSRDKENQQQKLWKYLKWKANTSEAYVEISIEFSIISILGYSLLTLNFNNVNLLP